MVFTQKHIINAPSDLVVESLQGLCAINPQLSLDVEHKVVYRKDQDRSKVALISGGGSGHEPAHSGFVGKGILTAAVCGSVFASPNASQVKKAISLLDNEAGTLIVVKNYTGDVLCFGLAREHHLATQPAKADKVKFVIVGDDVAVGKTRGSLVGRRGLAGTVLVYKIAGALAEQGKSLNEVHAAAQWVADNVATVGVGLEHCHVPGTSASDSEIGANSVEVGLGIHNEPGFTTLSPIPSAEELINHLLDLLTSTSDPERSFLPFTHDQSSDEVVLLVNNLGGISELELGGVARQAVKLLQERGVIVRRLISGTFMTSLNMPGFSLTLLLLPRTGHGNNPLSTDEILSALDTKTETPGWKWSASAVPSLPKSEAVSLQERTTSHSVKPIPASEPQAFDRAIFAACKALIDAEAEITRLDRIAGDGDCGTTLRDGAEGVQNKVAQGKILGLDVIQSIVSIAGVAEEQMGGTSGAIYSIFFSAVAQGLSTTNSSQITLEDWIQGLSHAQETLYRYSRARPPSRTLVDPLVAFIDTLRSGSTFAEAVSAASSAADNTANIEAKAGRSVYVESQQLKGIKDPGAEGVSVVLQAILKSLNA